MIPSRAEVPEHWKAANGGPYRQAPPMYGGQWWYVNPFTGGEPWKRAAVEPVPATLPEGFADIFGEEPQFKDYRDSTAWRIARDQWALDLERFKGAGRPLWLSAEQAAELDAIFVKWGMGRARFYGGRYGEMVRWPDSAMPDFEQSAYTAAHYPHQVIAMYQVDLVQMGVEIPAGSRHPFVPPFVFAEPE